MTSHFRRKKESITNIFSVMQQTNIPTELKKEMLVVYTDFAEYVLAMAKLKDADPLFTDMLSVVNTARKYYAGMLARRKGVAAEAV